MYFKSILPVTSESVVFCDFCPHVSIWMPKLISSFGLNKSVCPKPEYMIQWKTFHFETVPKSIWKDISLSYCLAISVLTSLFSDMIMDPRGLRFFTMKCESSCTGCLEHQGRCQSDRQSNVCEVQTRLIAGLPPQAEWDHVQLCSVVPILQFPQRRTDPDLPLSLS